MILKMGNYGINREDIISLFCAETLAREAFMWYDRSM